MAMSSFSCRSFSALSLFWRSSSNAAFAMSACFLMIVSMCCIMMASRYLSSSTSGARLEITAALSAAGSIPTLFAGTAVVAVAAVSISGSSVQPLALPFGSTALAASSTEGSSPTTAASGVTVAAAASSSSRPSQSKLPSVAWSSFPGTSASTARGEFAASAISCMGVRRECAGLSLCGLSSASLGDAAFSPCISRASVAAEGRASAWSTAGVKSGSGSKSGVSAGGSWDSSTATAFVSGGGGAPVVAVTSELAAADAASAPPSGALGTGTSA
mmetsp:Transcript_25608/g.48483  ORF Transcript_25608/g.48483 Transcript_25608/m.48483 type:complete len:273 (+) Transcript_25608:1352-2170(+)